MSPYRASARKEEPKEVSYRWKLWAARIVGVALGLLIVFLIHSLIALSVKFVVTGFAERPIGSFWHYWVATTMVMFVWAQIKNGGK